MNSFREGLRPKAKAILPPASSPEYQLAHNHSSDSYDLSIYQLMEEGVDVEDVLNASAQKKKHAKYAHPFFAETKGSQHVLRIPTRITHKIPHNYQQLQHLIKQTEETLIHLSGFEDDANSASSPVNAQHALPKLFCKQQRVRKGCMVGESVAVLGLASLGIYFFVKSENSLGYLFLGMGIFILAFVLKQVRDNKDHVLALRKITTLDQALQNCDQNQKLNLNKLIAFVEADPTTETIENFLKTLTILRDYLLTEKALFQHKHAFLDLGKRDAPKTMIKTAHFENDIYDENVNEIIFFLGGFSSAPPVMRESAESRFKLSRS